MLDDAQFIVDRFWILFVDPILRWRLPRRFG
jgi:hypothetical protein